MKTVLQYRSQLIGFLLLAVTIGLLWLMHVTSVAQQRCDMETVNISLLKLI